MAACSPSAIATDPAVRQRFLDMLRATGSVAAAAKAVGVNRSNVYRQRRRDRAFAAAWTAILGDPLVDALEAAVIARATHGVVRTRRVAGGAIETSTEFDNKLAIWLLGKLVPATYGDTADGGGGVPPRRLVSRAEFIAAIEARPELPPPDDDDPP